MTASPATPPLRGTQSFVGVMAEVWKRPSLTAVEIAWRWTFGVLAAAVIWTFARNAVLAWVLKLRDADAMLVRGGLVGRGEADLQAGIGALLVGMVVWSLFAGVGRSAVLRRWDPAMRSRTATAIVLALVRSGAFAGVLLAWLWALVQLASRFVWTPMQHGAEPAYVPGFALAVTLTLLLFMFWATVSWILRIAPVLALAHGLGPWASLRAALWSGPLRSSALRSKLIEINLVMGIVKVALLVLGMVFSASPLPFTSAESQSFLIWWWISVGVLYAIASDYFHVVRAAAYTRLFRAFEPPSADTLVTAQPESAS